MVVISKEVLTPYIKQVLHFESSVQGDWNRIIGKGEVRRIMIRLCGLTELSRRLMQRQ